MRQENTTSYARGTKESSDQMSKMPKCYCSNLYFSALKFSAFTHPFTHIGVDYFGRLSVRVERHEEKR